MTSHTIAQKSTSVKLQLHPHYPVVAVQVLVCFGLGAREVVVEHLFNGCFLVRIDFDYDRETAWEDLAILAELTEKFKVMIQAVRA